MDLDFYVRVRTCKKRVTGKQPLGSFFKTVKFRLEFSNRENENRGGGVDILVSSYRDGYSLIRLTWLVRGRGAF